MTTDRVSSHNKRKAVAARVIYQTLPSAAKISVPEMSMIYE